MRYLTKRIIPLAAVTAGAIALAISVSCSDDVRRESATVTAPHAMNVQAGSGSIWTTFDDCTTTQDANHFAVGHKVALNGGNFAPGVYDWSITGQGGGASADPNIVVASGQLTIGADGTPTDVTGSIGGLQTPDGHQFCFFGYRIQADDNGEYKMAFGGKNDNYRVDGLTGLAKTAATDWARTYSWAIAKSVLPTSKDLFSGESAVFTYSVEVTRSPLTDLFGVHGAITVTNPNPSLPALVNVVDCLQVMNGTWGNVPGVDCVTVATSLPIGTSTLNYSFPTTLALDFTNKTYRNLVTVSVPDGQALAVLTANATFTKPAAPTSETLGTVHVTDSNGQSWTFSASGTQTYTETETCPANHTLYGLNTESDTAKITETEQKSIATISYSCNGLTVSKTAATSYTKTFTWAVNKTVDPATSTVMPNEPLQLNYAVTYSATSANSNFAASGTIHIVNSNATRAATLNAVVDTITGGFAATVNCGGATSVPAAGSLDCTYTDALPNADARTNTASVVQQLFTFDASGTPTPSGTDTFTTTANVVFNGGSTVNQVDECINVSDNNTGTTVTGTVCASETLPKIFTYSRTVTYTTAQCGPQTVNNTASFITNYTETSGNKSATANITVACQFGCTLTQGYWKTHSLFGPAPYDPAWTSVGGAAATFSSGITFYDALRTPPAGNAWYQLAKQYIAAVLNSNNGASVPSSIQTAMTSAAALFAANTPATVGALKGNASLRQQFISLAGLLGSYNEGTVGPGHCTESPTNPQG